MGDGNFRWWVGRGEDPEIYHTSEPTRGGAIQVGKTEHWSEDDGFTIVEADKALMNFNCFDADQVLEQFDEHNIECWGEDGPDYAPSHASKRELEIALSETLKAWIDGISDKPQVFQFGDQRNQEFFPAPKEGTE